MGVALVRPPYRLVLQTDNAGRHEEGPSSTSLVCTSNLVLLNGKPELLVERVTKTVLLFSAQRFHE
jgi:hypothetical protein